MFYSPIILTKKGPLGKIWLAAHLQHKLSKAQVFSTDVVAACEQLQSPEMSFALRLSSNLLLGIVRIYSRKAHYLFIDSREALNKLQLAFQGSTVDLAPGTTVAPYSTITMEGVEDISQPKRDDNSKKSSKRSRYDLDRFSETSSNLDIEMLLDMDTDMAYALSSSEFRWNETAQSLSRVRARPEDITLPPVEMDFIYQMPDTALEQWDDHETLHRENINMNMSSLSSRASLQSPEVLRRESRANLSDRISLDRLSEAHETVKEQENPDWNFSMEMDAESFIEPSPNLEQTHETSFPLEAATREDSSLLQELPLPLQVHQQEQPNAKKRKADSNSCIFTIDRNSEISAKTLKKHLTDTKDLVYRPQSYLPKIPEENAQTWLHMILEPSFELPCLPPIYTTTVEPMLLYYSQGDLNLPQMRHVDTPSFQASPLFSPGRDSMTFSVQDNDWGEQIAFEQESFQLPTTNESIQMATGMLSLNTSSITKMYNEEDKESHLKQNTLTQTQLSISSRTIQTLQMIRQCGTSSEENITESKFSFSDFLRQVSSSNSSLPRRRLAAQYFYELLVLKSIERIQVEQDQSFSEIMISNLPTVDTENTSLLVV
ncbi:hypothetical protein GpartN1_g5566.t1 [Galdieria partita]|uniref:Uncharacterized protein n=1 Tax=Galdieria partita TaxID=83374 RepID=A0A9C7Q0F7_9RHOD|nr:hypothetical protein GpartN1_g5566.t1 [Galdieria partita]